MRPPGHSLAPFSAEVAVRLIISSIARRLAPAVSPTIFRVGGLRFLLFFREEERMHVHVQGTDGEAKIWLEPEIEVARSHRLSEKTLGMVPAIVREREDEIRQAWNEHFGR